MPEVSIHFSSHSGCAWRCTVGTCKVGQREILRERSDILSGARSHLSALSLDPAGRAELYAVPKYVFGFPIVWVNVQAWET